MGMGIRDEESGGSGRCMGWRGSRYHSKPRSKRHDDCARPLDVHNVGIDPLGPQVGTKDDAEREYDIWPQFFVHINLGGGY